MGKEYTYEVNELDNMQDLLVYVSSLSERWHEPTMMAFVGTIIKAWAEEHELYAPKLAKRLAEMMEKVESIHKKLEKMEIPDELIGEKALKWIFGAGTLNFGENEESK